MDKDKKQEALVSMTNKDTYYIDAETAEFIQNTLSQNGSLRFVRFVDTKSGSEVTISVANISSVVVMGNRDESAN